MSEETLIRYERRPELDKRIAHGDDYAGDAYVRWVAVGQVPDGDFARSVVERLKSTAEQSAQFAAELALRNEELTVALREARPLLAKAALLKVPAMRRAQLLTQIDSLLAKVTK